MLALRAPLRERQARELFDAYGRPIATEMLRKEQTGLGPRLADSAARLEGGALKVVTN
jgi:hypothetical protein